MQLYAIRVNINISSQLNLSHYYYYEVAVIRRSESVRCRYHEASI